VSIIGIGFTTTTKHLLLPVPTDAKMWFFCLVTNFYCHASLQTVTRTKL